jgi:hypothetical protein
MAAMTAEISIVQRASCIGGRFDWNGCRAILTSSESNNVESVSQSRGFTRSRLERSG